MPKASTVQKLINDFGGPSIWELNTSKQGLFCRVCATTFSQRRSLLLQHTQSEKHKNNLKLVAKGKEGKQRLLSTSFKHQSSKEEKCNWLASVVCEAFVSSNIPLFKLEHPSMIRLFEQIGHLQLPSRRTIGRVMQTKYEDMLANIRAELQGKSIFIIVDETTDCTGRAMCAVLVGPLDGQFAKRPFLIHLSDIGSVNSQTLQQCIMSGLVKIFGEPINYEMPRLLLTDAASYCIKAGKSLKSLFPNLLHITCVCHALHRVAENVRQAYPKIDKLVAEVKKIFVKAPRRRAEFAAACQVPLPPLPVVTR